MNEDEQIVWGQPISFLDFVLRFLVAPNLRRVELVPKVDPLKFYTREKIAPPSQDLGEIRDANKERVNKSLSNYASNNFLLSTSNIRPDLNGRYNPGLGLFAGDLTALTLSMGFDPFNTSNYYKVATLIPKFRNWGLTRLLANELNNEVRVARELGKNVGKSTVSPIIRTKIGDVEINNPRLYYHLSGLGKAKNFFNTNRMRTPQEEYWLKLEHVPLTLRTGVVPGFPQNPGRAMFSLGKLWYGLNPEQFPDLLVTAKEMPVANSKAGIVRGSLLKLESQGTRRVTSDNIDNIGPHTNQNTSAYTYIPGYGYRQIQLEPRTSLRFFERPLSRISEAEKAGVPRGERNFKSKWHVANYPGYLLKGLMGGSPLEKLLSKNGTININQLNAYFNKASQVEKEVANKVIAEKFAGLKTIDYNLFKKAILDELINYSTKPQTRYSTYGMDRLGFNVIKEPDGAGGILEYLPGVRTNTFTFESPRISIGNNKHYDTTTLGHSRTFTTPDEPNVLYVMESQSDWGQHPIVIRNFTEKYLPTNEEINSHNIRIIGRLEKQVDPKYINEFLKLKYYALKVGTDNLETVVDKFSPEFVEYIDKKFPDPFSNWSAQLRLASLRFNKAERSNLKLLSYLHDNYLQRQLQENLRYASENGLTKMRYPTSETAAKIEGYPKRSYENVDPILKQEHKEKVKRLFDEATKYGDPYELYEQGHPAALKWDAENQRWQKYLQSVTVEDYAPEYRTILKKYADFPKLFLKLFKDLQVRTVNDAKGNSWYEVDVPKGYLSREWQYKSGGILMSNNPIQRFKNRNK